VQGGTQQPRREAAAPIPGQTSAPRPPATRMFPNATNARESPEQRRSRAEEAQTPMPEAHASRAHAPYPRPLPIARRTRPPPRSRARAATDPCSRGPSKGAHAAGPARTGRPSDRPTRAPPASLPASAEEQTARRGSGASSSNRARPPQSGKREGESVPWPSERGGGRVGGLGVFGPGCYRSMPRFGVDSTISPTASSLRMSLRTSFLILGAASAGRESACQPQWWLRNQMWDGVGKSPHLSTSQEPNAAELANRGGEGRKTGCHERGLRGSRYGRGPSSE
jgi:hypothetical protein